MNFSFSGPIKKKEFSRSSSGASHRERLQKAIARNKAKRNKKDNISSTADVQVYGFCHKRKKIFKNIFKRIFKKIEKILEFKLLHFFVHSLVKLGWFLSILLFIQLIVSNGGVFDYYDKKVALEEKVFEGQFIEEENKQLKLYIEKIMKDEQYQKKLVRDHLGFISKDEFLVLFSRGKG